MLASLGTERPTIGLILSFLDGDYQSQFWHGVHDFCREADLDLIIFASRFWRHNPIDPDELASVYRLADSSRIGGLCVDASAFVSSGDLGDFLAGMPGLRALPVVTSSIPSVSGAWPTVQPDNALGVRLVLEHLAQVHGCRRIAMVCGPQGDCDARARLAAYRSVMAELGLPAPDELILPGAFDLPSGREAALRLLQTPGGLPDAVFFANDDMANGGLQVFREHGVAVPGQVRVAGFDNSAIAAVTDPPLATVDQDLYGKGRLCAELLAAAMDGRPVRDVPSRVRLIPRDSCGCAAERTPEDMARLERQLVETRNAIQSLHHVTGILSSVLRLEDLAQCMGRLQSGRQGALFVSLYEDGRPEPWMPSIHARVVAAADGSGQLLIPACTTRRFLSTQIVPAYLLPDRTRRTLVVQPLSFLGNNFGFLTKEYRGENPSAFTALRDLASAALHNVMLISERDRSRAELEQALARAERNWQRYSELAYFLPILVMETDPEGRIVFLNSIGQALLGLDKAEVEAGPFMADFLVDQEPAADSGAQGGRGTDAPGRSYRRLRLRPKSGQTVTLLAQSSGGETAAAHRRWIGLDFKPIIGSLTSPGQNVLAEYGLTAREREILSLELTGMLGKEIADRLGLSLSTVKAHIGSLYRKVGVSSRDQLFAHIRERMVGVYGFDSLLFSFMMEFLKE